MRQCGPSEGQTLVARSHVAVLQVGEDGVVNTLQVPAREFQHLVLRVIENTLKASQGNGCGFV